VLICGIGGQGAVFLGSYLRNYFLTKYPSARIVGTENRGVSQREGSVIASMRIQTETEEQNIFSPEIPPMSADLIIALEPLEMLRNFHVVHRQTIILTNNEPIMPKSSVKWLVGEVKGEESESVKKYAKSDWLIAHTEGLFDKIPIDSSQSAIKITKPKKKPGFDSNIPLISYSKHKNILDLNFYSLVLEELEESSLLNFVMLGFLATICPSILDFPSVHSFSWDYFKEESLRQEQNSSALRYGKKLAGMHPQFI